MVFFFSGNRWALLCGYAEMSPRKGTSPSLCLRVLWTLSLLPGHLADVANVRPSCLVSGDSSIHRF